MATYTLTTISHIQWYLCTLFIVHTSRVPWYSSRHPPYSDVWQTNWLRQPSCFLISSALDISNITFAFFFGISGPSGSYVLCKIIKGFTNLVALPSLVRARGNCPTKKMKEVQGKINLFIFRVLCSTISVPWESSVGFCSSTDEAAG
jgi:hypothetical protein